MSSTAPEEEVRDQLNRNGLLHFFRHVYGRGTPKARALAEIVARHPGEKVIFFGDSLSDLDASQAAGVAFVAVVNERDNFKALDVVKLPHFCASDRTEQAMHLAMARMRNGAFL